MPSLFGLHGDGLLHPDAADHRHRAFKAETTAVSANWRPRRWNNMSRRIGARPPWYASFLDRLAYVPLDATRTDGFAALAAEVGDPCRLSRSSCRPRRACSADHRRPGERRAGLGRACGWRWKSRWARSGQPAATSTTPWPRPIRRTRFSASIIISARKRSRTCWRCGSAISCSNRCGTPPASSPSRSASAKPWGWKAAAIIMTAWARCATWCRTTCCNCWRWSPWNRQRALIRPPCAMKR